MAAVTGAGLAFLYADKNSKGPKQSTAAAPEHRVYLPVAVNTSTLVTDNKKGLCYSPYRDGQNPNYGPYPTEGQMKEDISILNPVTQYLRTYGANHNMEYFPRFVQEMGSSIKVNAGCWLGTDTSVNDALINNVINEANTHSNVVSVNEEMKHSILIFFPNPSW